MVREFESLAEFASMVGKDLGTTDWITITQEDVDTFADVTRDRQWIHVDVERSKAGPYGATLIHGYLVMSLMAYFSDQIYTVAGLSSSLNYGSNRVRFPSPAPVGSRLRGSIKLLEATELSTGTKLVTEIVVEREYGDKPVCVAEIVCLMT